jgi:hypothetical protein
MYILRRTNPCLIFCLTAGGLARWVSYGFKTWAKLTHAEQHEELTARRTRWEEVLGRFSTAALLAADRAAFNDRFSH